MKQFFILKGGSVDVSGAPEVISVLPLGHVVSSKGEFDVDAESLESMKRGIAKRGVDLVVDYEHQTPKGTQAPAVGWVKELFFKDGSIRARVEWTPITAEYLKNKEYRYLSPITTARKSDGKAMGLHSIALTNTPAIEGMSPIVNSDSYQEGGQNNINESLQKLVALPGLGEDATEEDILEAFKKNAGEMKTFKENAEVAKKQQGNEPPAKEDETVVANKAVCELPGLKAGASTDDMTAKIMELKGGTIGGVNVLEKARQLEGKSVDRDAEDAITMALKGGKATAAQKGRARSYALSGPKGLASFVEKAPQVVPMDELSISDDVKSPKSVATSEEILLVCKVLGVSKEDIEKYGKEQKTHGSTNNQEGYP